MTNKEFNLSPSDNFDSIIQQNSPIIVDFYADWCGPCRKLSPILESEASKNSINLCKVNVDNNRGLSSKMSVSGIPLVILFIEGKEAMRFVGYDENELNKMINLAKSKVNKFQGTGTSVGGYKIKEENYIQGGFIPNEPDANSDCYHLVFRYNNQTFERRFAADNTIGMIKNFIRNKLKVGNITLFTPFPRKNYTDDSMMIQNSGISKKEVLNVALI